MSPKALVSIGALIGSTVGGYLPLFFGYSTFSFMSLTGSTVGAFLGIFLMYQFNKQ